MALNSALPLPSNCGERFGTDFTLFDDLADEVSLIGKTVGRRERGEITYLARSSARVRGHAAGFHTIDRSLGNRVNVLADLVFVPIAVFADAIGDNGSSIFEMDRVSERSGRGQRKAKQREK